MALRIVPEQPFVLRDEDLTPGEVHLWRSIQAGIGARKVARNIADSDLEYLGVSREQAEIGLGLAVLHELPALLDLLHEARQAHESRKGEPWRSSSQPEYPGA